MQNTTNALYMQIYNDLLEEIKSSKYAKNERLPTELELSKKYYVSRITSKKALNMLAEKNYIIRIKGKGSFVSPHVLQSTGKIVGKTVGVIMPNFFDAYGKGILYAIEEKCRKNNMFCMLRLTWDDQAYESKSIEDMIEYGVSGLIINPVHGHYYNKIVLKQILDGFPVVVIDRKLRGIPSSFVGTNNVLAGEKAMDYLISKGHKKIAIFSSKPKRTSSLEDRLKGALRRAENEDCLDVQVKANLWQTHKSHTPDSFEKSNAIIAEHLTNYPETTAIIAANYQIAAVVKHAVTSFGLKVPDDISIICFDSPSNGCPLSEALLFEFTHVRQKEREIGEKAFDVMLKLMNEETSKAFDIEFDSDIIEGNST